MPDRLTVILPPIPSDEERIAEALDYNFLTEGDGWSSSAGASEGGNGWGDGGGYGTGSGSGYGDGYSFWVGDSDGDGGSSTDV
jgi:hypothetical protein